MEVTPHPKPAKRKAARTFRKRASRKEWRAIAAEKWAPCRVCGDGPSPWPMEFHHLIPRAHGGADVADNIVMLCRRCHRCVTERKPYFDVVRQTLRDPRGELARRLTDAEYAYIVGKLGEGGMGRLFGV